MAVGDLPLSMKNKLRILFIHEDDSKVARMVQGLQHAGFEVFPKRVDNSKSLQDALNHNDWHLVIAEYQIPALSSRDAIRAMRQRELDIPFIVVSDSVNRDLVTHMMRSGAHDCIEQSDTSRLVEAIRREVRSAGVRKEHQQAQQDLYYSEERFDLFMQYLPGLAYIKDADGRFLYVNDYMHKINNWSPEDVIGKRDSDLWDSDYVKKLRADDMKVLESGEILESIEEVSLGDESFYYLTTRFPIRRQHGPTVLGAISINITARITAVRKLEETTKQLEMERQSLEKKNIALREILDQIDHEKAQTHEKLSANLEKAVLPTVRRLKESAQPSQLPSLELLEKELSQIASPFIQTLQNHFAKLSPRELEVCRLIKNGMTSKEIAEMLNLSLGTIQKHREMIRRKLGLTNDGINLHSYLQSL
ncbi:PAS domain-containing protein [candidate division GN15 bacterium]|nr:PAS domain-containing protein [candidate division GN15 bacterium]